METKIPRLFGILAIAFLLIGTALAQAATGTATTTFSANGNPAGTEYFIEQKGGTATAPTWTEVAKGTASPIVFSLASPTVGSTVTFRVRARTPGVANSASGPSNEASTVVPNIAPTNFTIVFAFPPSP